MPSGLMVLLCRPSKSVGLQMSGELLGIMGRAPLETEEGSTLYAVWLCKLFSALFVQPKFSIKPGADEIGPRDLTAADAKFILKWFVDGVREGCEGSAAIELPGERPTGTDGPGRLPN